MTDTSKPENIWSDELYVKYYLEMMDEKYPESQTEREANFIEGAINLFYGDKLLDLCSGSGRHAISMAKRGYQVMGLDLSNGLVEASKRRASESSVKDQVDFIQGDVRKLHKLKLETNFKAAYCLATVGFHMTDQDFNNMLTGVYHLLDPGGYLIIDVINRENLLREFNEKDWTKTRGGYTRLRKTKFDFKSSCTINQKYLKTPDGEEEIYYQWMRTYTLKEMVTFLENNGLNYHKVYGNFKRTAYSINSPRMIVVANKDDSNL
ncbi:class I SAM-dependent methyltransferase [Natranaerobius thermophilus]|uniref:class I SAM-dependent methyltransferase n=1 Tax=Natranaerobius thermophilus TaxID=375929 RepID=UPI00130E8B78|nr:class I SAM-dependent methyltransferase [Natranaerobius thermophilus]